MSLISNNHDVTVDRPWLGLRAYDEHASRFFYGRTTEVNDLKERVLKRRLTLLYGKSGLGKTSLLQGKFVAMLRQRRFLPVVVRLDHGKSEASLEMQVLAELISALEQAEQHTIGARLRQACAMEGGLDLWLAFHDPEFGLCGPSAKDVPMPVMIFDQFEEIFTVGDIPERANYNATFVETLAALTSEQPPSSMMHLIENDEELAARIDYRAGHYRLLLALRDDFLNQLMRWRPRIPSLFDNRFELLPLTLKQALAVVIKPGELRVGKLPIVPDDVAHAIVRFVTEAGKTSDNHQKDTSGEDLPSGAEPPLLSLVCSELNAERIAVKAEQITLTQVSKRAEDILKKFYQESFRASTYGEPLAEMEGVATALEKIQEIIEHRLVSADNFRQRLAYGTVQSLIEKTVSRTTAEAVITALVERRLLARSSEKAGNYNIEVTHDVLTKIIAESRDEHQREKDLREATRQRIRAEEQQQEAERDKLRIQKERDRLRTFATVAMLAATIAIVSCFLAIHYLKKAKEAEAVTEKALAKAQTSAVEAITSTQAAVAAREEADRDRERAENALKEKNKLTQDADEQRSKVTGLKAAMHMVGERLGEIKGIQPNRERIMAAVVGHYEKMAAAAPNDPDIVFELQNARLAHAEVLMLLGRQTEARPLLNKLSPAAIPAEKDTNTSERMLLLLAQAQLLEAENDPGHSTHHFQEAEALLKRIKPPASANPAVKVLRVRLLLAQGSQNEPPSEEPGKAAQALCVELLQQDEKNPQWLGLNSLAQVQQSKAMRIAKKTADSKKSADAALTQAKAAVELDPDSPQLQLVLCQALREQAKVLAEDGVRDAAAMYKRSVEIGDSLAKDNQHVPRYVMELSSLMSSYADYLSITQNAQAALEQHDAALKWIEDSFKLPGVIQPSEMTAKQVERWVLALPQLLEHHLRAARIEQSMLNVDQARQRITVARSRAALALENQHRVIKETGEAVFQKIADIKVLLDEDLEKISSQSASVSPSRGSENAMRTAPEKEVTDFIKNLIEVVGLSGTPQEEAALYADKVDRYFDDGAVNRDWVLEDQINYKKQYEILECRLNKPISLHRDESSGKRFIVLVESFHRTANRTSKITKPRTVSTLFDVTHTERGWKITTAYQFTPDSKPSIEKELKKRPSTPPSPQEKTSPPNLSATKLSPGELPFGTVIAGRPGFITSPYAAKHQLVDVTGLPEGMEVKCPYSGKIFRIPKSSQ